MKWVRKIRQLTLSKSYPRLRIKMRNDAGSAVVIGFTAILADIVMHDAGICTAFVTVFVLLAFIDFDLWEGY